MQYSQEGIQSVPGILCEDVRLSFGIHFSLFFHDPETKLAKVLPSFVHGIYLASIRYLL